MKKLTQFFVLLALGAFLTGCSSSEPETSATDTPTEKTKPESTSSTTDESKTDAGTPTATMVACAGCKQEFAADKLKDHDGVKMCEACIASHNH